MSNLYSRPLKVYVALGFLALWGVLSGLGLSISLFPQSNQATIGVTIGYGGQTAQQFFDSFGRNTESNLRSTVINKKSVEDFTAEYENHSVHYRVRFPWGVDPQEAQKQLEIVTRNSVASLGEDVKRSISVWPERQNQGFYAASFYSSRRSMDELYQILNPIVSQISSNVPDSSEVGLYNPNQKEIRVTLSPEKLAMYGFTTEQVEAAVRASLGSMSGGEIRLGENSFNVILPKIASSLEALQAVPLTDPSKSSLLLKDVAQVSIVPSEEVRQRFRTSGNESLILFGDPKEGGNIKQMADDIQSQILKLKNLWPDDVEFKVLVNPAEFIDSSIKGVIDEVALAALLAVFVLFLFIGSFKNVVAAAIEIPLSLVMAFILMKYSGMNLNLISLGGLALSAGMNVDASVVVMENIFRYMEKFPGRRSPSDSLALVMKAVNEVKMPIIASTLASLVVFVPLIMTSGLTNSLLGDLAKAVVFSHGFSAIVALILVPTIRLQLMQSENQSHFHSPIEGLLKFLEAKYSSLLNRLIGSRWAQRILFVSLTALLAGLVVGVVPRLNKEVIGKPETDWLIVGFNSPTLNSPHQVDSEIEILDSDLRQKFGDDILYTFSQVNGSNGGMVMMRLRSKKLIEGLRKKAEKTFTNTPTKFYWVNPWNPSELRIPDPPQFRVEVVEGSNEMRNQVANDLRLALNDSESFDRLRSEPETSRRSALNVEVNATSAGDRASLSQFLRIATRGLWVDELNLNDQYMPIYLRMEKDRAQNIDQLKALPIAVDGKIVPIASLGRYSYVREEPDIYRENGKSLVVLTGKADQSELPRVDEMKKKALVAFENFRTKMAAKNLKDAPTLVLADAEKDLTNALDQLKWAVILSVLLIFLTMVFQFGDLVHSLLVLVAIPLGFIGVTISLYVFHSTLSLNSGLGTILLNGIAVANSIILVDFMRRLVAEGYTPRAAALEAARARLRPILMTSITTVLGMLPVALGMGEGGKILQPLGIAVCGGLWISMLLTLFVVPCLQCVYLESKANSSRRSKNGVRQKVKNHADTRNPFSPLDPADASL